MVGRKSERQRQPVSLQQIVQDAPRLLRASLPTTIAIRHHFSTPSGTVFADPTQLHQVLMNLGSNAERAMREIGGLLEVHLEELELDHQHPRGARTTTSAADDDPG
jgi:C4-dicarboxylate-specific signal transduction histidine kinase